MGIYFIYVLPLDFYDLKTTRFLCHLSMDQVERCFCLNKSASLIMTFFTSSPLLPDPHIVLESSPKLTSVFGKAWGKEDKRDGVGKPCWMRKKLPVDFGYNSINSFLK